MQRIKRKLTKQLWFDLEEGKKVKLYSRDGEIKYKDNEILENLDEKNMKRLKLEYLKKSFLNRRKNLVYTDKDFKEAGEDKKLKSIYAAINTIAFDILFKKEDEKSIIDEGIVCFDKEKIGEYSIRKNTPDDFGERTYKSKSVLSLAKKIKDLSKDEYEKIFKKAKKNSLGETLLKEVKKDIYYNKRSKKNVYDDNTIIFFIENSKEKIYKELKNLQIFNVFNKDKDLDKIKEQTRKTIESSINDKIKRDKFKDKFKDATELIINESIEEYKLEELFDVKDNNKEYKIKIVKDHYNNTIENLFNSKEEIKEDNIKKQIYRFIHQFFKKRALEYDRTGKNDKCFLGKYTNSQEFKNRYEKLIKRAITFNKMYEKQRDNKDKYYSSEKSSVRKQLAKARETLLQKIAQNITNIQVTLAHSFDDCEEIREFIENDFISLSSENKIKDILGKIEKKIEGKFLREELGINIKDIYMIMRIRNITHHYQKFEKEIKDEDLKNKIYNDKNNYKDYISSLKKYKIDYIKKQLESNGVTKYYTKEDLQVDSKSLFHSTSIVILPRFSKVLSRIKSIENIENLDNSDLEENNARKYILQLYYENDFKLEIEDKFKTYYDEALKYSREKENIYFIESVVEENTKFSEYYNEVKIGSTENEILNINKRIVDIISVMFIKYLEKKEKKNLLDIRTEESKEGVQVNDDDIPDISLSFLFEDNKNHEKYFSFISLCKILKIEQMNLFINDFKKYIQSVSNICKCIYKDKDNEIKIFMEDSDNLTIEDEKEILIEIVDILEYIKYKKNMENERYVEYSAENKEIKKEVKKEVKEKLQRYYKEDIKDNLEYTWKRQTENGENEEITDILSSGEELIKFKFLLELDKYGISERFIRIHKKAIKDINYHEILVKYGKYKSHIENSETKIAIENKKFKELINEFKNWKYVFKDPDKHLKENSKEIEKKIPELSKSKDIKGKEVIVEKYVQGQFKEIEELNKKIREFDYIHNILYLGAYRKGLKIVEELLARGISLIFRIEREILFSKEKKDQEKFNNKSVFDKENISQLFSIKEEEARKIVELRQAFVHYKILRNDPSSKNNKYLGYSLYKLYEKLYEELGNLDLKYRKSIKDIFTNVCLDNYIEVDKEKLFREKDNNSIFSARKKEYIIVSNRKEKKYSIENINEEYFEYLRSFIVESGIDVNGK